MDYRKMLAHFSALLLIVFLYLGYNWYNKSTAIKQFTVTPEKMMKDIEGKQVQVSHGQMWPFDSGQGLTLTVLHKKQVEHFIVVIVDVSASATVDQPKDQKEKEKNKLPSKVSVSGHFKLTYEAFDNSWYLIAVDSLTGRAAAQFD